MPAACRYRTHFRPVYKISYKMVTELEWRCCPGYQGYDCMEVKDMRLLQVEPMPHPPTVHGTGQAGERQLKIIQHKVNRRRTAVVFLMVAYLFSKRRSTYQRTLHVNMSDLWQVDVSSRLNKTQQSKNTNLEKKKRKQVKHNMSTQLKQDMSNTVSVFLLWLQDNEQRARETIHGKREGIPGVGRVTGHQEVVIKMHNTWRRRCSGSPRWSWTCRPG